MRPGTFYMICGPTGSGKQTLINMLRERHPEIHFTVSCTTRPARRSEDVDGSIYHFVTPEHFESLIAQGAFLEWARVHGNYYGTLRSELLPDRPNITDIDIAGVEQVRRLAEQDPHLAVVTVFVSVNDIDTLRRRITLREPTITPEDVARRLETARHEMIRGPELADIVIHNEDGALEAAFQTFEQFLIEH